MNSGQRVVSSAVYCGSVERNWPGSGAWIVAATSAEVDWRRAVAGLAAAAEVPVAVVALGAPVTVESPVAVESPAAVDSSVAADEVGSGGPVGSGELVREHAAGLLEGVERLDLRRAMELIEALTRAYPLVIVSGEAGLLLALGPEGWALADLAVVLKAPVVLVTGPDEDAANLTTLALDALEGRGLHGAVVTVGDVELPVPVAGRIAADVTGDSFDPMLRATGTPVPPPPVEGFSGRRVVTALLGVFAVCVLVACVLGRCATPTTLATSQFEDPTGPRVATVPSLSADLTPSKRPDPCWEGRRRVTPAKPDTATTIRVNAAWKRIEMWLAANTPETLASLGPPATPEKIDELQRRMSVEFPPDLTVSLLRHDGAHRFSLPPFFHPSSLEGIFQDWQTSCQVLAGADTTWAEVWWHPRFVPFAADGAGGSLLTDQRPGGHGRVGEFDAESGTRFERWPDSVADLLDQTAAALETGEPFAGAYRPRIDEDKILDWEIL
ncbi:Cell wall assembly regulator SMI1 [Actinoplanes derwentensis]|uniref:Cell wall assembly regulator SMI1 n=1 Tax=Actinoplanes derwentensis TaxID=113562 RepID=A0A1H1ZEE5_9ACTN|nr:Cell wall assembly regulator SMI1 [Actinoplanes derwentensis]